MGAYTFTLSGAIGFGEIELSDVLNHLAIANGKDLEIRFTSVGGDVQVGTSIRNSITAYKDANDAEVVFDVLGWAQSAGSFLLTIPGARVRVRPDTLFMMHNPRTWADGDYNGLNAKLKWLMPVTELYRNAYTARGKADLAEITRQLDEETFLIGQQIVDAGFADELVADSTLQACGNRDEIIQRAQNEFKRLQAAAMGGLDRIPARTTGVEETIMSDNAQQQNLVVQPGVVTAPAAAPVAAPVAQVAAPQTVPAVAAPAAAPAAPSVEDETARARAYGQAMRHLPATMHDAVQKAFDENKPASYFAGMVAHANALAAGDAADEEANAHAEAQALGKSGAQGVGHKPSTGNGQPAATVTAKAAGETGAMIEVG